MSQPDVVLKRIANHTRFCERCGCTDEHGCEEGCWWIGETLCSACGPGIKGRKPKLQMWRVQRIHEHEWVVCPTAEDLDRVSRVIANEGTRTIRNKQGQSIGMSLVASFASDTIYLTAREFLELDVHPGY